MPVSHAPCIEQVGRQPNMAAFDRIALDVGIAEQALFGWLKVAVR